MCQKIIFTSFVFLLLFGTIGQAQIATKGIDLSYLQQLVQSIPDNLTSDDKPVPYGNIGEKSTNSLQQKTTSLKTGSDNFHINFMDVLNKEELSMISTQLDDKNYPITILHKDVFATYTQLLLEYDLLIYKYVELEKTSNTLKTLQQKEIEELHSIIDLEKEKSRIMRKSRDQIMKQTKFLNQELNQSLDIEKKKNRRDRGKKFLTGAIGGAVGFAVGVLLMEFAR